MKKPQEEAKNAASHHGNVEPGINYYYEGHFHDQFTIKKKVGNHGLNNYQQKAKKYQKNVFHYLSPLSDITTSNSSTPAGSTNGATFTF